MTREELELTILTEVSRTLGSTLKLNEIFESIVSTLARYLDMRRGTLVLLDESVGKLRIHAACGLTREEMARGTYDIGEGVTGYVVQTGEAVVVEDVTKHPMFLDRTGARRKDGAKVSFICVPIKIESRVVGALSADRTFVDEATLRADKRLLSIISAMIAQAIRISEMVEIEKAELAAQNKKLRQELASRYRFENIVGVSPAMQQVFETTAAVADSRASVLIVGETGTGKELIAHAIHYNSPRRNHPFIRVNCGALSEGLLESELFGHVRGAFTGAIRDKKGRFEAADGGTIFLDEVSNMSERLQVKLLRVLQEREFERVGDTRVIKVDVRVIAATNKDLEKEVKAGRFREDLFYRLNVIPIFLPPLRERKEDIPLLVEYFLNKYNRENNKDVTKISRRTLELLVNYPWPGNVRELENCIERVIVLARGKEFAESLLPINIRLLGREALMKKAEESLEELASRLSEKVLSGESPHPYKKAVSALEKRLILGALHRANDRKLRAAAVLGINRNTLRKKMKELEIEPD